MSKMTFILSLAFLTASALSQEKFDFDYREIRELLGDVIPVDTFKGISFNANFGYGPKQNPFLQESHSYQQTVRLYDSSGVYHFNLARSETKLPYLLEVFDSKEKNLLTTFKVLQNLRLSYGGFDRARQRLRRGHNYRFGSDPLRDELSSKTVVASGPKDWDQAQQRTAVLGIRKALKEKIEKARDEAVESVKRRRPEARQYQRYLLAQIYFSEMVRGWPIEEKREFYKKMHERQDAEALKLKKKAQRELDAAEKKLAQTHYRDFSKKLTERLKLVQGDILGVELSALLNKALFKQ